MKDINMELAIEILKRNFIKNFKEEFVSIPTGFQKLDQELDGGLKSKLYVLGGRPGVGKSTFLLQLAHQISKQNKSVMIFSFDKKPNELMIKLISHHTFEISKNIKISKTIAQVENCINQESLSEEEQDLMDQAYYLVYSCDDNLQMVDAGENDLGVEQIEQAIKMFQEDNRGDSPVILVDDLQCLSTAEQSFSKNLKSLKKIACDYEIPVFCSNKISRRGCDEKIDLSSFHVSVKCAADVVLALQEKKPGGVKLPKGIEFLVLKNGRGSRISKIDFEYYEQFNYFEQDQVEID